MSRVPGRGLALDPSGYRKSRMEELAMESTKITQGYAKAERAVRPFLKWVGGKSKLLPALLPRLPGAWVTYREPFLGGGALFFALRPPRAVLSDVNDLLIRTYRAVRDDVGELVEYLDELREVYRGHPDPRGYYYEMRGNQDHWTSKDDVHAAVWFIFINKAGFSGLWRVNSDGLCTTPWGVTKAQVASPEALKRAVGRPLHDPANLQACSQILQDADLRVQDFREAFRRAEPGDLVYCDPPYVPVSATANFTGYSTQGFKGTDQRALRDHATYARDRGVQVVLSNSDTPAVREAYAGWKLSEAARLGTVNSKADARQPVTELIITST